MMPLTAMVAAQRHHQAQHCSRTRVWIRIRAWWISWSQIICWLWIGWFRGFEAFLGWFKLLSESWSFQQTAQSQIWGYKQRERLSVQLSGCCARLKACKHVSHDSLFLPAAHLHWHWSLHSAHFNLQCFWSYWIISWHNCFLILIQTWRVGTCLTDESSGQLSMCRTTRVTGFKVFLKVAADGWVTQADVGWHWCSHRRALLLMKGNAGGSVGII